MSKFRVRRIYKGGPHGWRDRVEGCESADEAIAKVAEPMTGGCYEVQADERTERGWKRLKARRVKVRRRAVAE